MDDIRHHAIPDHSWISILICTPYQGSEFFGFEDVLHNRMEQKVSVLSLVAAIVANRPDHEAERPR